MEPVVCGIPYEPISTTSSQCEDILPNPFTSANRFACQEACLAHPRRANQTAFKIKKRQPRDTASRRADGLRRGGARRREDRDQCLGVTCLPIAGPQVVART
ncbi:hypothetical protein EYF80_027766 [Liparis tanakae]|uniref:Uncharacterized protein n=1 Tax=Liparis tanakae TaxID=230148 RepID=A0A4Z2H812_9TELE|nr:hypothetical protein EYF80_027766 [Liparis tanakae]